MNFSKSTPLPHALLAELSLGFPLGGVGGCKSVFTDVLNFSKSTFLPHALLAELSLGFPLGGAGGRKSISTDVFIWGNFCTRCNFRISCSRKACVTRPFFRWDAKHT